MIISNRAYPILDSFKKGTLGILPVFKEDENAVEYIRVMNEIFKDNLDVFNNINMPSKQFLNAADLARNKLAILYTKITDEDKEDFELGGTYIYSDNVAMLNFHKHSDKVYIVCLLFSKKGVPLLSYQHIYPGYAVENGKVIWASNALRLNSLTVESYAKKVLGDAMVIGLFKKYAEIETKILPPNKVIKDIGCKYVNSTNENVTFLDSKWFTNLVKSDSFKVRGHFRLQPVGEKRIERKIIWVNDFEKSGYTAPSRKTLQTTIQ